MTIITISYPRLYERRIVVFADSAAALITHDDGINDWEALVVDGRYYNMVRSKHVSDRPEIATALDQALADVRAAIDALRGA